MFRIISIECDKTTISYTMQKPLTYKLTNTIYNILYNINLFKYWKKKILFHLRKCIQPKLVSVGII